MSPPLNSEGNHHFQYLGRYYLYTLVCSYHLGFSAEACLKCRANIENNNGRMKTPLVWMEIRKSLIQSLSS